VTRALSATELRRRPHGARYSQRQLDRALAGELTVRTTRKGSAARSAVTRAKYAQRVERAETEQQSRAQARGHPARGESLSSQFTVEWSTVTTTAGVVDVTTTTRLEASRVGAYLADTRKLLEGRIEPSAFRRRWSRRIRTVGGFELEPDPDAVLALVFVNGPGPVDRYRRLDAGRPR
jgi:hypothetical protein